MSLKLIRNLHPHFLNVPSFLANDEAQRMNHGGFECITDVFFKKSLAKHSSTNKGALAAIFCFLKVPNFEYRHPVKSFYVWSGVFKIRSFLKPRREMFFAIHFCRFGRDVHFQDSSCCRFPVQSG